VGKQGEAGSFGTSWPADGGQFYTQLGQVPVPAQSKQVALQLTCARQVDWSNAAPRDRARCCAAPPQMKWSLLINGTARLGVIAVASVEFVRSSITEISRFQWR
jgi:hypothetical protein